MNIKCSTCDSRRKRNFYQVVVKCFLIPQVLPLLLPVPAKKYPNLDFSSIEKVFLSLFFLAHFSSSRSNLHFDECKIKDKKIFDYILYLCWTECFVTDNSTNRANARFDFSTKSTYRPSCSLVSLLVYSAFEFFSRSDYNTCKYVNRTILSGYQWRRGKKHLTREAELHFRKKTFTNMLQYDCVVHNFTLFPFFASKVLVNSQIEKNSIAIPGFHLFFFPTRR